MRESEMEPDEILARYCDAVFGRAGRDVLHTGVTAAAA